MSKVKVIDNRDEHKDIHFCDINDGEFFLYDNALYIKRCEFNNNIGDAFDITRNIISDISPKDIVIPVRVTITIEEELY